MYTYGYISVCIKTRIYKGNDSVQPQWGISEQQVTAETRTRARGGVS